MLMCVLGIDIFCIFAASKQTRDDNLTNYSLNINYKTMTQEEKNKLLQFITTMRNETIEEETKNQLSNKKTDIIEKLKCEIAGFETVMESNNIDAEREKQKGSESWKLFHLGKVDAYRLVINKLKDIIKDYE